MLSALNLFFTEMMKIAEDYGGVEKNTRDGLMAYFDDGMDVAASKKTVACALTMMRLIAPPTPLGRRPHGRSLCRC